MPLNLLFAPQTESIESFVGSNIAKYGLQGMMLLSFAKGLGINNDLMFFINRRNAIITLDRAFAGGYVQGWAVCQQRRSGCWSSLHFHYR